MRVASRAAGGWVAITVLALAACDGRNPEAAADERTAGRPAAVAGSAEPAYRSERRQDLTGDGRPERLTVAATGPRNDSLEVRLTILGPGDSVLHADQWRSADYFKYIGPPASLPPDSVRRVVRRHLESLLGDSAFVPLGGGTAADRERNRLEAIRYDVAEHRVRVERGVAAGEPLSAGAYDAIERAARTPAVAERAAALARELRGRPTFRYYAGGEVTHTVAWSPSEGRFVRVYSCC